MGLLIPEDFPLDQLANDAERSVVAAFCDQLLDSWYVIPSVAMRTDSRTVRPTSSSSTTSSGWC